MSLLILLNSNFFFLLSLVSAGIKNKIIKKIHSKQRLTKVKATYINQLLNVTVKVFIFIFMIHGMLNET